MKRDYKIDLFRVLGVLIIMVAHSHPPGVVFQIRNFGTPLLIVASALATLCIYPNGVNDIWVFYKKRFLSLVVPAWKFLVLFFLFFLFWSAISREEYPFSISEIVETFAFYEGIGFFWIFKVYLLLAVITPFSLRFSKSGVSNFSYYLIILLSYIFYEATLMVLERVLSDQVWMVLGKTIFIVFPYSLIFLLALRLERLSSKSIVVASMIFLSFFIFVVTKVYVQDGILLPTQVYKYPPRAYYLAYALFCILSLYIIVFRSRSSCFLENRFITWVSKNSLDIYLFHIVVFYVGDIIIGPLWVDSNFILRLLSLCVFSCVLSFFKFSIFNDYLKRKNGFLSVMGKLTK
ncbi:acyltransferase family protein [Agarivorans sp. MS3-6]